MRVRAGAPRKSLQVTGGSVSGEVPGRPSPDRGQRLGETSGNICQFRDLFPKEIVVSHLIPSFSKSLGILPSPIRLTPDKCSGMIQLIVEQSFYYLCVPPLPTTVLGAAKSDGTSANLPLWRTATSQT